MRYLPALVFPFVKIFGKDKVICFEVVLTVVLNWCKRWFDYFPNAPLSIIASISDALQSSDVELFAHLTRIGGAGDLPGTFANPRGMQTLVWPLLQSLLSEALPRPAWLRVWDHLVLHHHRPELLPAAIVALLIQ